MRRLIATDETGNIVIRTRYLVRVIASISLRTCCASVTGSVMHQRARFAAGGEALLAGLSDEEIAALVVAMPTSRFRPFLTDGRMSDALQSASVLTAQLADMMPDPSDADGQLPQPGSAKAFRIRSGCGL